MMQVFGGFIKAAHGDNSHTRAFVVVANNEGAALKAARDAAFRIFPPGHWHNHSFDVVGLPDAKVTVNEQ